MTKYFTLPVLLCALAIASFARISVSAPTNGSTLPSPVNFVATADSSHGIVKMAIYVDSRNVWETSASSLKASIAMSSGQHSIVVEAWNSQGRTYTDSMTLNISSATAPSASATQNHD